MPDEEIARRPRDVLNPWSTVTASDGRPSRCVASPDELATRVVDLLADELRKARKYDAALLASPETWDVEMVAEAAHARVEATVLAKARLADEVAELMLNGASNDHFWEWLSRHQRITGATQDEEG